MQLVETAGGPLAALVATWGATLVLAIAESPPHALWILLGFTGAVFSGIFGIGVVLTVPLLLYIPPLIGRAALPIHIVTGTATVQVAVVGLMGALTHFRHGRVRWSLIPMVSGGMAPAALVGAALSSRLSGRVLEGVFAMLVVAAAVALFLGRGKGDEPAEAVEGPVNRGLAFAVGAGLGLLVGVVGLGGGFLLVPILTYLLHVPLRVAVGSSLGILAVTGLASMVGKAATGQIDWLFAAALVAGALPGVRLGAWVGHRVNVRQLSIGLGLLLTVVSAKMWWDILHP
jgi:uncharacterized membrane protein YfcA